MTELLPSISERVFVDHTLRTPLVPVTLPTSPETPIWCKLEFMNPSGSTKDRIASFILLKAFREGRVKPGGTVVEASSGSTSIAMAMVCAQLGLRFLAVMPAAVSSERTIMIRAFGGEVRLAPHDADMATCIKLAEQIAEQDGAYFPRQFENPDNANAHRYGTAREVAEQIHTRRVDAIVAGVGTGGTLVGLYQGLRDVGCRARPYVARPVTLQREGCSGPRPCCVPGECFCDVESSSFSSRIPGVVENMSKILRPDEMEGLEYVEVDDEHALETARMLHSLGFPVGPSSGLNFAAAARVAQHSPPGTVILTVLPDRCERYFSTGLFRENPGQ
jgi:cysteine synthase